MYLKNLFSLLNLDKKTKEKIIDSNPILKKYFPSDTPKRKPKRLNSDLAKKLEDPRHRLAEQFNSLMDIYKILEVSEFDELRKKSYIAEYERMSKIKNPKKRHYHLNNLYSQIQQDIEFFIGEEERGPIGEMPVEDQIQQSIMLGSKEFKEK